MGKNKIENKLCIYCIKEEKSKKDSKINKNEGRILALEKPYLNLWFHKKCLKKVENRIVFVQDLIDCGIIKGE